MDICITIYMKMGKMEYLLLKLHFKNVIYKFKLFNFFYFILLLFVIIFKIQL